MLDAGTRAELAKLSTSAAYVRDIDIALSLRGADIVISASYRVKQVAALDGLPLIFDCTRQHVRLEETEASGATVQAVRSNASDAPTAAQAVCLGLEQEAWDGVTCTFRCVWRHDATFEGDLLVLPEMLPAAVAGEHMDVYRPVVRIDVDGLDHLGSLGIGGVIAELDPPAGDQVRFLQVAIARSLTAPPSERSTPRRWSDADDMFALDPRSKAQAAAHRNDFRSASEWLNRWFGTRSAVRWCIVPGSRYGAARVEGWSNGAPVLDMERLSTLGLADGSDRAQLMGVLAAMWWGVGCKVAGPESVRIQTGFRLAVMLEVLRREGKNPPDASELMRQLPDRPEIILAARISRGIQERADVLPALRAVTRRYWGRVAPASEILTTLSDVGVVP